MLLKGLPLYRAILRQHRLTLPPHLRQLGDAYVKSEFRLHRQAKSDVLASFNEEWNAYLNHLKLQSVKVGAYLTEAEIMRLSPQQKEQLSKLKEEAVKAARGEGEAGSGSGSDPFPSKLG